MLSTWLLRYGYAVIFGAAALEGDAALLSAMYLAHRGYFDPWAVMAVAAAATVAANQVYFRLGHKYGRDRLAQFASRPGYARVLRWIDRHDVRLVLASRFVYGFRIAIPTICGARGMNARTFILGDALGAVVWSVLVGSGGYVIGHVATWALRNIERHEWTVAGLVIVAGIALLGRWRDRRTAAPGRSAAWRWTRFLGLGVLVYGALAYVVVPRYLSDYIRHHPGLARPHVTHTVTGLPGDPVNVALIGTEDDLLHAMTTAQWVLAARLGLDADLRIAESTLLGRPDPDAPVSNLYLFGRREDLAFEQEVNGSPRQRHHVRFWRTPEVDAQGRPAWVGAAVYDRGVTLSGTTGQFTHAIAPDIDDERDYLFRTLSGSLHGTDVIDGYQREPDGRNGDGAPWHTDGRLFVGVVAPR